MSEFITIPLTQGKEAIIEADDLAIVSGYHWIAAWSPLPKCFYAVASTVVNGRIQSFRMHRVILDAPDGLDVDHRDGNGLNNRRSNLRIATRSQNLFNTGLMATNTSGFKGVSYNKTRGKWVAGICVNGKKRNLGGFDLPEDAARAYDRAASQAMGEFAWLNFPEEIAS